MDSIFSTLSAPLQQVITHYFYKVIQIEDQTIKNSVALILNILIGYVLLNGFKNIKKFYKNFKNKYFEDEDYIDLDDFDYSEKAITDVRNYTFSVKMNERALNNLHNILKNKKAGYLKSSKVSMLYTGSKFIPDTINGHKTTDASLCMPVYKYNKNEYIWVINTYMYSNNKDHIEKYYSFLYNHKTDNNNSTNTSDLYIKRSSHIDGYISIGHKINPNKTFNKLFFREKENLINVLNKFSTGNLYSKSLELDNKLGILLYGPPGTGKTGTITAIANYLNRDIITYSNISFLSKTTFDIIGNSVLVLDEFDYILSRPSEFETEKKDMSFKELELRRKEKTDDEMNKFLKFLDGLESVPNRVIIATTNYPEKINPVFLRPGRFDLKLELSYCDSKMFEDIIKTVYPDFIVDEDKHNKYINKNLTPLTLINSLAVTNTLEDCFKKL